MNKFIEDNIIEDNYNKEKSIIENIKQNINNNVIIEIIRDKRIQLDNKTRLDYFVEIKSDINGNIVDISILHDHKIVIKGFRNVFNFFENLLKWNGI